jgi:predicted enzyme related to lactoylglutathione lyase
MSATQSSTFAFTKLVVHDVERLAQFYAEVYGLHAVKRVRGERIGGEEIDEIVLSPDPASPWGSFVLLRYLGRAPSPSGELILGFTTGDLDALLERVEKAGGRIQVPPKPMPDLGLRVAFATDPEGHLAEIVEMHT